MYVTPDISSNAQRKRAVLGYRFKEVGGGGGFGDTTLSLFDVASGSPIFGKMCFFDEKCLALHALHLLHRH